MFKKLKNMCRKMYLTSQECPKMSLPNCINQLQPRYVVSHSLSYFIIEYLTSVERKPSELTKTFFQYCLKFKLGIFDEKLRK